MSEPHEIALQVGLPQAGKRKKLALLVGDVGKAMREQLAGVELEGMAVYQVRIEVDVVASCRNCFCTEANACEGGCWWVEVDLCSRCAKNEKKHSKEKT